MEVTAYIPGEVTISKNLCCPFAIRKSKRPYRVRYTVVRGVWIHKELKNEEMLEVNTVQRDQKLNNFKTICEEK